MATPTITGEEEEEEEEAPVVVTLFSLQGKFGNHFDLNNLCFIVLVLVETADKDMNMLRRQPTRTPLSNSAGQPSPYHRQIYHSVKHNSYNELLAF